MWWIAGAIIFLWLAVYLIPDVLFHHLQLGAFAGSRETPHVAITFDDGPGSDTGDVLDALQSLDVRSTFFVVSERALANPGAIDRMIEAGHEVGLHMKRHVSAFLTTPWRSYREVREGLDQVAKLTGQRPTLFRPPWGHMNLGTWLAVRQFRLTPVFWNIAPDDWRPDRAPEWMSRYVVQLAQPGTVVVMHDAGGSRQRTVESLPGMVAGLREVGLLPTTVSQLTRDRSFLRRVWTWWEIRFTRGWNIHTIPNSAGGEPILRIGHIAYRGRPTTLADGTWLSRGDPMGEIHFGNPALSQFSGQRASGLRAMHGVMSAMTDLSQWLKAHPAYHDVKAVGGVTLLDAARTIERLGFQRVAVHGWTKWSMWFYLIVLMSIYHRDGWKTLRRFRHLEPVMVLMDVKTLDARYGTPRTPRKSRR